MTGSPALTAVPSSMTHLMMEAVVPPWVAGLDAAREIAVLRGFERAALDDGDAQRLSLDGPGGPGVGRANKTPQVQHDQTAATSRAQAAADSEIKGVAPQAARLVLGQRASAAGGRGAGVVVVLADGRSRGCRVHHIKLRMENVGRRLGVCKMTTQLWRAQARETRRRLRVL